MTSSQDPRYSGPHRPPPSWPPNVHPPEPSRGSRTPLVIGILGAAATLIAALIAAFVALRPGPPPSPTEVPTAYQGTWTGTVVGTGRYEQLIPSFDVRLKVSGGRIGDRVANAEITGCTNVGTLESGGVPTRILFQATSNVAFACVSQAEVEIEAVGSDQLRYRILAVTVPQTGQSMSGNPIATGTLQRVEQ